jgi:hypothetical protein
MRMAMTRNRWCLPGSKWFFPLFAAALGFAMFVALWIGGNPVGGIYSGTVIVAFGLVVLLGGRSETIRGLRGDGRDERFRKIDVHATAFAGTVLITVLIVMWMVDVALGHDGYPYGLLSALAGLSYLAAIAFMRWRS